MQIGNVIIEPWNRKNTLPRLLVLIVGGGLLIGWLYWGVMIWLEGQRLDAARQQREAREQRREEVLRRQAAYRQRVMQEEAIRSGVQNAIDGVKR